MKDQLVDLLELMTVASIAGVGVALGTSISGVVMAGIGLNLVSNILQNGATKLKERWLSSHDGILNHDIQHALIRAFIKALTSLEDKYFLLPESKELSKKRKQEIAELFQELRDEAQTVFLPSIEKASNEEELRTYLYDTPQAATTALWERITGTKLIYTYYGEHVTNFLRDNCSNEVVFWFGEELKTDNKESNKAWRAFQRLLLEGIQADLKEVLVSQDLIQQDLQKLNLIRERLDEIKGTIDRLPDEPFAKSFATALQEIKTNLHAIAEDTRHTRETTDHLKVIAEEINNKTDLIAASLKRDRLKSLLEDVQPVEAVGIQRFSYYNVRDAFAGRDEVVDQLLAGFLAEPNAQSPRFRYCYIEGEAGAGKSRLALELLRKVKQHWPTSGTVRRNYSKEVIECLRSNDWLPAEPTFVVIDYAAEALTSLGRMLVSLAVRRHQFQHPLRILLLARSSDDEVLKGLVPKGSEGGPVEECAQEKIVLPGLNAASCAQIMRARIESVGGVQENFTDEELDRALVLMDENRKPLWAAITGELLGKNAMGSLSTYTETSDPRRKALTDILERERGNWEEREQSLDGSNKKTLRLKHETLLALATMTRGLPLTAIWTLASESSAARWLPTRDGEFDKFFYEFISDHDVEYREDKDYEWLRQLEPDLFGEMFVDLLLSENPPCEGPLKELAWRIDAVGTAEFAILFEFDFGSERNPLRFLPKTPPREDRQRLSVSQALVGISYTLIRRLFAKERWSDPSPGSSRLSEEDKTKMLEGVRSLRSEFETESGRPPVRE